MTSPNKENTSLPEIHQYGISLPKEEHPINFSSHPDGSHATLPGVYSAFFTSSLNTITDDHMWKEDAEIAI